MFLATAFILTAIVFGFAGWLALRVAKPNDEEIEGSRLTKNQVRALAWLVAVAIAAIGAIIEFKIILGE